MNQTFTLPDTRPYPQNPIKNHLLLNAYQLAHNSSQASRKLSSGQLQTEIRGMLEQNHYINLSLALTMSPDAGTYAALLSSVNAVLDCEKEGEVQWFALPVVLVSGCKKERAIEMKLPTEALFACLQNYPHLRALTQETQWLPYLVHSSDLSAVAPDEWWRAKQNTEAAAQHLRRFAPRPLLLPEGQSVHVVYALGFGSGKVQTALGQNLLQAGLPLMQVWQENLASGRCYAVCQSTFPGFSGTRAFRRQPHAPAYGDGCFCGKRDTRRPYAESARRRGRCGKGGRTGFIRV